MLPQPDEAERRIASSRAYIVLALITLVAAIIRSLNLSESLWVDELHTGWVVNGTWADVAERARLGNQSPLWFYAVKIVFTLLGPSEFSLRLLSFLAGTALIPSVYFLARKLNCGRSHIAALAAAAIVTIDHACVFYSSEARPYSCVQLTAAWQLFAFLAVCDQPTNRNRFALIGLTALAFHLHYTAILIVLGEAAYLLGCYVSRRPTPYRFYLASCDTFLGLPLLLAALPQLRELLQRRGMWSGMVGRPEVLDLWTIFPLWPAACGLIVAVIFLIIKRDSASLPRIGSLLAWFFVPILIAWWTTRFDYAALFFGRYLVSLTSGPALLAAIFVSVVHRERMRIVLAMVLFGLALYQSEIVPQVKEDGRAVGDRNEDWRGAIGYLNERIDETCPIYVSGGLIEERSQAHLVPDGTPESPYFTFPGKSLYRIRGVPDRVRPLLITHGDIQAGNARYETAWAIQRISSPTRELRYLDVTIFEPIRKTPSGIMIGSTEQWIDFEVLDRKEFGGIAVSRLTQSMPLIVPSPNTNPTPPDPQ